MIGVDREMDLERLGTRSPEMEGRHLRREGAGILSQVYVTASPALSTLHPTWFFVLLWGLILQMPLSIFPLQSAVRCVQNDGQRVSLSLIHGHWALGTLLLLWEPSGSSSVSEKLPEKGLESELQKDGIAWLSTFKKPNKRQFWVLGSVPDGELVNWGLVLVCW